MTRRRSKARLRTAIAGVVVLTINVVAFGVFTWPRLTRVHRAEERARAVSTRRASFESLWSRLAARRELVARNRSDIDRLSRDYLKPRATDLFAAQREIESLAKEAGLHPKRSSYSLENVKGTDLIRCEVTLPLDGTYAALTGFLSRIESAKRFLVVDQMALSQDDQSARMNLKLSALFRGGDANASR